MPIETFQYMHEQELGGGRGGYLLLIPFIPMWSMSLQKIFRVLDRRTMGALPVTTPAYLNLHSEEEQCSQPIPANKDTDASVSPVLSVFVHVNQC